MCSNYNYTRFYKTEEFDEIFCPSYKRYFGFYLCRKLAAWCRTRLINSVPGFRNGRSWILFDQFLSFQLIIYYSQDKKRRECRRIQYLEYQVNYHTLH